MPAVIKLGCPRRFMVSDLLRHFEFTTVLQIRRDAGRAEGMIANPRFDAGRFRAPTDNSWSTASPEATHTGHRTNRATKPASAGMEELLR